MNPFQLATFAQSLLGLPYVPWQLTLLGIDENGFLEKHQLLRAVPNQRNDDTARYLLFPSRPSVSVGDAIAINSEWIIAQSLAYFLNIHILSLGWWDLSTEDCLGRAIKSRWHSGASLPLKIPKISRQDLKSTPVLSLQSILLHDRATNSFRPIQDSDWEFENQPFHWEIIPSSIDWTILETGRDKWTEIFQKSFASGWRGLGKLALNELGVSPVELYRQQHINPDLEVNSQLSLSTSSHVL
jgi:hypothetical protein